VALARALIDTYHHEVAIFCNLNMVGLCTKHGVDAKPVFPDAMEVIQNCGGLKGSFLDAVRKPAKAAEKWMRDNQSKLLNLDDELEVYEPHLIVAGSMVVSLCLKFERAKAVPVIPTFFSCNHLELEAFNILIDRNPVRPSFYAASEAIDRKPSSFKKLVRTSAWTLPEAPTVEDLSPNGDLGQLKQFLEDGSPPVAVGWGSMLAEGMPPAEMLEMALRALMQVKKRGVILGGWAELERFGEMVASGHLPSRKGDGDKLAAFAKDQVCFVPYAPHEWLYPRCCCVVHHGGVGTTQAALRAGRPAVVTPICADQFTHASTVQELGAGVGFTQALPLINSDKLAKAITQACNTPTSLTAEMVGKSMRKEENQGMTRAIDMIDGFLRGRLQFKGDQWIRLKGVLKKKVP
jgi:hypothetical protein